MQNNKRGWGSSYQLHRSWENSSVLSDNVLAVIASTQWPALKSWNEFNVSLDFLGRN